MRTIACGVIMLILAVLLMGRPLPAWGDEAPAAETAVNSVPAPTYPVYGKDEYPGAVEAQPRFQRPIRWLRFLL